MPGFFSKYFSLNHLFKACLESFKFFLAKLNLSLTIFCCSSLLLNIEASNVNDLSLSLYLTAKFLAINEPIENPIKWILLNFNSFNKLINCSEKSSKLIIDLFKGVLPCPRIS